jgi:hypothetical protein
MSTTEERTRESTHRVIYGLLLLVIAALMFGYCGLQHDNAVQNKAIHRLLEQTGGDPDDYPER